MKPGKISRLIFKLFKRDMIALSYSGPQKKDDLLEFVFFCDGHAYYKFKDDAKIPLLRKLAITQAYMAFMVSVSEFDISESIAAIVQSINQVDAKGKMKPDIAKISHICSVLLSRKGR